MRVRVSCGLLIVALLIPIAGCSGSSGDSASTTTSSAITTATVTPLAPTVDPAATTVDPAPTTSATVTPATGTGALPSVTLGPDGVGVASFGDDAEATIMAVSGVLGPPDDDTGFVTEEQLLGFCGLGGQRSVRWGDLNLGFVDEPIAGYVGFVAYAYVGQRWTGTSLETKEGPLTPAAATAEGITVFDALATARQVYGEQLGPVVDLEDAGLGRWADLNLGGPWPVKLWLDAATGGTVTRIESNPCGE